MISTMAKLEARIPMKVGEEYVEKVAHLFIDHDTSLDACKNMMYNFIEQIIALEQQLKTSQQTAQETTSPEVQLETAPAVAPLEEPKAE